jgi:hypothetical protein
MSTLLIPIFALAMGGLAGGILWEARRRGERAVRLELADAPAYVPDDEFAPTVHMTSTAPDASFYGPPVSAEEQAYYDQRDLEGRADYWVGHRIRFVDPSNSRRVACGVVRYAYAWADGENGPSAADEFAPVATLNVSFDDGSRSSVNVDDCERI